MLPRRTSITATTDASGDVTAYSADVITGRVLTIKYVADGSAPYDNTADFTFSGESTAIAVMTVSNVSAAFTKAPRQPTHSVAAGATLIYAGTDAVCDHVYLVNERLKLIIAQGGNAKTGTFIVVWA